MNEPNGIRGTFSKQRLAGMKRLLQKKYREEEGLFIVEGWKSLAEAVGAGIRFRTLLIVEGAADDAALLERLIRNADESFAVSEKELADVTDAVTPQGIAAVMPMFDPEAALRSMAPEQGIIVAADSVNDPGNLGTIIRTADWFGAAGVVIGEGSAEPYNPKTVRATMGSLFHLPVAHGVPLPAFLRRRRQEGWSIITTEVNGSELLGTVVPPERSILVIGSESHGVSEEISSLADLRVAIPKFGTAESLNAAMACGIILSHFTMRRS